MKQTIYILLIFLAGQAIGGILLILGTPLLKGIIGSEYAIQGLALLLANLLILITLWRTRLAAQRSAWAPLSYWGGRRLWLSLFAMLLLAFSLSLILEPFELNDLGTQKMFEAMSHDPACILRLCVVGPLVEEVVFRDGVLRQLVRWGLHPLWAVVMSSALFAMVHGNPQQAIPAFVLGMALGMLFARTGDLRLCLPAHIFNNTLAVILLWIPGAETFTQDWSLAAHIILGIALFLGGADIIYRLTYADRKR